MNPTRSLSVLFLAAGLGAQIAVFPGDHAAIANGAGQQDWFPYSHGISRMMALYESWDLAVPNGHQVNAIGFRAEGTTLAYGKSLLLEVRVGPTNQTADTLLNDFDNNYLGAPTTVFGPAVFAMPDLNNVLNPNPAAPYIWLPLTTPFLFDNTHNLLVEWRVYANTNGGAAFSYTLDAAAFVSPIVSGPPGCLHSGNQIPILTSRPTKVGDTWITDLMQAPANQLAILFVNVGVPLTPQWPLGPFFAGIQPTCQGQLSLAGLASMASITGPSGYLSFSVPIPNNRLLNDLTLASQAFCFDFFAPGGLVVSNGDQMQIGIDPAMSVLYHQGSATNATGNVWPHFGAVTLFAHW